MTNRYDAAGVEAEFEPGSQGRVLRNLLGIRSAREMSRVESAALLEVQRWMVEEFTATHRFGEADIRRIHRHWLKDIYIWAGNFRSVNIAKADFHFAAAAQIPRLMAQFEAGPLAEFTPCHALPSEALPVALATVHAELVLIHPFREGNGRLARLLALAMGLQAGLPPLNFDPMQGRGKGTYIAAVQAALARDYRPMTKIFSAVVQRSLRQAVRDA